MFDVESLEKFMVQLKRHEGCKKDKDGSHICYRCTAKKLTLGYGHNLEAWPVQGLDENSRITEEEATNLLQQDVEHVYQQVQGNMPFFEKLDPARKAVLVNMAFNLGISALLKFKNTLRYVDAGNYTQAASNMLDSRWATQVGQRAKELSEQMRTGTWA